MLRSVKSLDGCTVAAIDGDVGHIEEAYFDDEKWGIRYLVVEAGNWFREQRVLISPYSIRAFDRESAAVHVDLTLQQIMDSPNIDTHKPVSRQHEQGYLDYYNYPQYWGGAGLWGMGPYPVFDLQDATGFPFRGTKVDEGNVANPQDDIHLRSTDAVRGYHIEGSDGSIGHVSGYLFDDVAWVIRYLIVDVRNWLLGGKEVLVATSSIETINWTASTVLIKLTRDAIKSSRDYTESTALNHDYEPTLGA